MATLPKPLTDLSRAVKKNLSAGPRATTAGIGRQRESIAAAQAKTHFLRLLDQVQSDRVPITITRRGRIIAQLIPASEPSTESPLDTMIEKLRGRMKITGDIVSPDHEFWGPEWR